jgi:hypothetical protein
VLSAFQHLQQPLGFTLSTKAESADDLLAPGVILRPVREPSLFKDPKAFGYWINDMISPRLRPSGVDPFYHPPREAVQCRLDRLWAECESRELEFVKGHYAQHPSGRAYDRFYDAPESKILELRQYCAENVFKPYVFQDDWPVNSVMNAIIGISEEKMQRKELERRSRWDKAAELMSRDKGAFSILPPMHMRARGKKGRARRLEQREFDQYKVEQIVEHKIEDNVVAFKVRWVDYGYDDNWYPAEIFKTLADGDDDTEEFRIEKITAYKRVQNQVSYQAKWVGLKKDPMWYRAVDFKYVPGLLERFHFAQEDFGTVPPSSLPLWSAMAKSGIKDYDYLDSSAGMDKDRWIDWVITNL